MKTIFITLLAVVLASGLVLGQSITLESVDGLTADPSNDILIADNATTITFNLRVTNNSDAHFGCTNGFRVYSDDGATWTTTVADTFSFGWKVMFDLIFIATAFNPDGAVSDTCGFGGSRGFSGTGLTPDFDEVSYKITVGPLDPIDEGKTICLDSSFYPPTGTWKWVSANVIPSWDGPHCFYILSKTDVQSIGVDLPTDFALSQNYPNPFNPVTNFKFDLPTKSKVSIKVYNVLGQVVNNLVDQEMDAGSYLVDWDGTADDGEKVSSGVYFYKMIAGDFVETKKMMMLK